MPIYDILLIGDLRFPGGTATAMAEEIQASLAGGYRVGVVHMRSSILSLPHPFNPKIQAFLEQQAIDLVDPDCALEARLCCFYHPQILTRFPLKRLRIKADVKLLIATHPPADGWGEPYYDCSLVDGHLQEWLGGDVRWAPVGPLVRRQLLQADAPPPLVGEDWHGVVEPGAWAVARPEGQGERPVIGRHSRPDPAKWPDSRDAVLEVYPASPEVEVRVLGGGPYLLELLGSIPSNWQVWGFNQLSPKDFLGRLDLFVYFHHSRWVEAFGFVVLEALASRLPAILPPCFEPLFGEAALYARPEEVGATVQRLHALPELKREQSDRAAELVAERFSHAAHRRRVGALIGPPHAAGTAVEMPRRAALRQPRRVMMISSNGVGMGHLTRLLAIARRLPPDLEPGFVTMSQAAAVVQEFGYPVEYLPYHGYLDCDVRLWNHHLRRDLDERLAFYQPAVVLFDGNVPYDGLVNALAARPDIAKIWCRRAMWTPESGAGHVWRERFFDAVIEPGEIAGVLDRGLTTEHRSRTRMVGPITLLRPEEPLERAAALEALGLDPDRPAFLLQLGAGNNYDLAEIRDALLEALGRHAGLQLVWLDWAIAREQALLPAAVTRLRTYPASRYLAAFEGAVSAAGYNAYHELLLAGLPTIFVPNENPMMDDQLARAIHADLHGLGWCLRRHERYRVEAVVAALLDPAARAAMRQRSAGLERVDGAAEAARLVEELAYGCRADLDPASDVVAALRRHHAVGD